MNISNKVSIPVLAGAATAIGVWCLSQFAHIQVPAEIATAFSTILMGLIGYAVPSGTA